MNSRKLTLWKLLHKGCCWRGLLKFFKHFGFSVEVTLSLTTEVAKIFYWPWAANHLLSSERNRFEWFWFAQELRTFQEFSGDSFSSFLQIIARKWAELYISEEQYYENTTYLSSKNKCYA